MVVVALDEGGNFENLKPSAKCMYIGGVVFQCKDDDARKKELERLQTFLEESCSKEGCKYPKDLHYNRCDGQIINFETANKVKNAVIKSLPDFLNGNGEWASNGPKGTYYIYALVGDKNGINYFENNGLNKINSIEEISNLINDNVSSNRYEHMAYRAIEDLLFYNTRFHDNNVRLNLATRVFNLKNNRDLEKETIQTGHEKHDIYDSTFKATTLSSYRAALISMIQNSTRKNIHFEDISVESIFYGNNPQHNLKQGFLYLSDIVCNVYGSILEHCNQADSGIEQLWQQCQQYAPKRFYVWSYDDFDQKYREIYKSFVAKDYYNCLKNIYLVSRENEKSAKVYDSLWFDDIKKSILFSNTEDEFEYVEKSINQLEMELENSEIHVDEARFIHQFLKSKTENICEKTKDDSRSIVLLYNLYKSEMTIYNHEGNYEASNSAFQMCKRYSQYVDVEEFLELQNLYSVKLLDSGEFEKATELTLENCELEKMVNEVKSYICPEIKKSIHQGRTFSQLGQCYSFLENYVNANENFQKSLLCYGGDDFNSTITRSYLLHMYIEQKNKNDYEKQALIYFGSENIKNQLLDILNNLENSPVTNKFKLYVYMKALFIFYVDDLKMNNPKLLKEILLKLETIKNLKSNVSHPWEMIYKYAAFCCLNVGNKEYNDKAEEYINFAKTSLVNVDGGILQKIIDEIDIQFESVKEGKDAFEKSKLTYMYR